jgi:hypothetical protein
MNPLRNRQFVMAGALGGLAGRCLRLHVLKVAQPVAQSPNFKPD